MRPNIVIDKMFLDHFSLIDKDIFDINTIKDTISINSSIYLQYEYRKLNDKTIRFPNKHIINIIREHDMKVMYDIEEFGIKIPKWYYNVNGVWEYLSFVIKHKECYLKAFNQARSMGKMIVTPTIINNIVNSKSSKDYKEFNKRYNVDPSNIVNNSEEEIMYTGIRTNNCYIMEKVDVAKEYRVLYFKGMEIEDIVVKERFGLAPNSKETRKNIVIDTNTINKDILIKLKEFSEWLNKPMLSFDVYIDKKGNWGLFEYSTQFGMLHPEDVLKKLSYYFNKLLLDKAKELKIV